MLVACLRVEQERGGMWWWTGDVKSQRTDCGAPNGSIVGLIDFLLLLLLLLLLLNGTTRTMDRDWLWLNVAQERRNKMVHGVTTEVLGMGADGSWPVLFLC